MKKPILVAFLFIALFPFASALAPSITVASPSQNQNYFTNPIQLNVTTSVNSNATYSLNDGQNLILFNNSISGLGTVSTSLNGQNKLTFTASSGSDRSSSTVFFNFQSCGVDATQLTAKDQGISFFLENTGSGQEDIDYSVKVNLNKTAVGKQAIQAGQKTEVVIPFVFKVGSYQVDINATAGCGSTDLLTGSLSKTGPVKCVNPDGIHGDFRSNSTEGKVYFCDNGVWKVANDFSYCNTDRCGDGVLDCGESRETCPQDFKESAARCDCANRRFYNETRKPDSFRFYDACKGNCSLRCISDFDCPQGYSCTDFGCVGRIDRCLVKVQDLDYTKEFSIGESGQAFATVKNSGLIRENITVSLFVDNSNVNQTMFLTEPDSERVVTLGYKAGIGDHRIEAQAVADCGSTDSASSTFSVRNISIIQVGETPLSTQVLLLTQYAQIPEGSQKPISIGLATTRPQIFTISVSGVPSDWLDYPQTLGVSSDKTINIFVKPKQAGSYKLSIAVQGSSETTNLEAALNVTQATPTQGPDQTTAIVFSLFTIILLGIAVFFGIRHLEL